MRLPPRRPPTPSPPHHGGVDSALWVLWPLGHWGRALLPDPQICVEGSGRPPATARTAGCPPISSPIAASVMEPQCYVRATAPRVPFSLDVLASGTQSHVPHPESAPKGRPSFSPGPCLPWCGRVRWGWMRPGVPAAEGSPAQHGRGGAPGPRPVPPHQLWGRVPLKFLKMRQKYLIRAPDIWETLVTHRPTSPRLHPLGSQGRGGRSGPRTCSQRPARVLGFSRGLCPAQGTCVSPVGGWRTAFLLS